MTNEDDPWLPWEGPERFDKAPKKEPVPIEGTKATKYIREEDGVTVIDLSAYEEEGDRDDDWGVFQASKRFHKDRRRNNVQKAKEKDDGRWTKHTEWHWSRTVAGSRLDYWPSRNKFQYKGKIHTGDVSKFIINQEERQDNDNRS